MTPDELLAVASDLLHPGSGRPTRAALDRAVSTAYYALFHALCHLCVDRLIGWHNRSVRYWDSVTPIYRLIDHGSAKRVLLQFAGSRDAPPELRRMAAAFVELQASRTWPTTTPSRGSTWAMRSGASTSPGTRSRTSVPCRQTIGASSPSSSSPSRADAAFPIPAPSP